MKTFMKSLLLFLWLKHFWEFRILNHFFNLCNFLKFNFSDFSPQRVSRCWNSTGEVLKRYKAFSVSSCVSDKCPQVMPLESVLVKDYKFENDKNVSRPLQLLQATLATTSTTHPNLTHNCLRESCIVVNVGSRFWQGRRICGIKKTFPPPGVLQAALQVWFPGSRVQWVKVWLLSPWIKSTNRSDERRWTEHPKTLARVWPKEGKDCWRYRETQFVNVNLKTVYQLIWGQ